MEINVNKIPDWNETVEISEVQYPTEANEIVKIPYEEADQKLVLLLDNGGEEEGTVTIQPGEMPMSGRSELVLNIPAETAVAVALESGRFKKKDGFVYAVSSSELISFQLIAMP